MNRYLIILLFFLTTHSIMGQLSFDSSVFPSEGDTLCFTKDLFIKNTSLKEGPDKTWDLSQLSSPLFETKRCMITYNIPAGIDKEDIFTLNTDGFISFFTKTELGLEEIGFQLNAPNGPKHNIPVFYNKNIVTETSSLLYEEGNYNRVSFEYDLDRSLLPYQLQEELPKLINAIKVVGTKTVSKHTDGWGSLKLPEEILNTNRVRVSEKIEIRVYDTETGKAIPYFDESRKKMIYPGKLQSNYLEFYTKKYKHYTARINYDDLGVITSIDYQNHNSNEDKVDINNLKNDFILYPNPTFNVAKVYISGQEPGEYGIAIYNIIGKKIWERKLQVDGQTIIKENFSFLPKGTYLISLLDKNGNILRTERLIIISV